MQKFSMNSNRTINNLQPTAKMHLKNKEFENFNSIKSQVNKPNQNKFKFTAPKASKLAKQSSVTKFSDRKFSSITENRRLQAARKTNIPMTSVNRTMPVNKVVLSDKTGLRRNLPGRRHVSPENEKPLKLAPVVKHLQESCEVCVQTNESEILNHLLIVGDYKIITPSKYILNEIGSQRREQKAKQISSNTRKFEEHSLKDEQHLDHLREFNDKCFITKKTSPPRLKSNIFEEDRKIIESMDEWLQREKLKTESITDIRTRIKRKEQELLSLFDHFQKRNNNVLSKIKN